MDCGGVWFRDEFSSGDLHGTVRPLSAALPRSACSKNKNTTIHRKYNQLNNIKQALNNN